MWDMMIFSSVQDIPCGEYDAFTVTITGDVPNTRVGIYEPREYYEREIVVAVVNIGLSTRYEVVGDSFEWRH